MERASRVRPVALEPPSARIHAERDESLERGDPFRAGDRVVTQGPAPRRRGLPDRDGLGERRIRNGRPLDPELLDEPRAGGCLVRMRPARQQHDPLPRAAHDHAEQATLVFQPGAVAVRLRHEPIQGLEVEHRLRQREAGEVPLDGADDDHGVELAARGPMRREDLDGVRLATFPRGEPGTALPGVHRRQERLDRRVGGGAGLRDGARERHDRVELAPRLDGGVGRVDQAARAGQLAPQDRERVEHRAIGGLRRPLEDPAHLLHVRGLLRRETVRELEGTSHGSASWCARPAGGRAPPPATGGRGPRSGPIRSARSARPRTRRANATPGRTAASRAPARARRRSPAGSAAPAHRRGPAGGRLRAIPAAG